MSLIDLLESIVKSYKQTKKILIGRRQQSKLNKIDEYVLEQLICLLKPFKKVLQLVQKGNSPSLYMVLPCTLTLRKALSSFDELLKYQTLKTTNSEAEDDEENIDDESQFLAESEGNTKRFSFALQCLIQNILQLFQVFEYFVYVY